MRKFISLLICCFYTFILSGQSFKNDALNALVNAEYAFIKEAKEFGTKQAFYNNLSDSAVTFGKTIRKGKNNYEGKSDTISWLHWKPVYTDIATSGDFGYNTGPWEFWGNRGDTNPVAFGEFVTVWEKQVNGKWVVLIDIGISHPYPMRDEPVTTSAHPLKKGKNSTDGLEEKEKLFIQHPDYSSTLSGEARIYRGNKLPVTSSEEINKLLSTQPALIYTYAGGQTASSHDLGYAYGTATDEKSENYFYLRIWKKENGTQWKIVLDLLTPQ